MGETLTAALQASGFAFLVPGWPATKGSTVSFVSRGRVVTKTDSLLLKEWTKSVGVYAVIAGVVPIPKGTGVAIDVEYEFPRPMRARQTVPCVRPDCDKLARALLDALTGIAYHDDGQVVALTVRKCYGGVLPLARVKVWPV